MKTCQKLYARNTFTRSC